MKAFVTGATGFIGSHLAERLISDPSFSEVRCLVRNRERWLSGKTYTKVDGTLEDLQALEQGMKGADVLFHIAAIVKAPTRAEFQRTNIDATEYLIHLASKHNVRRVVILSSLAAAGPSDGSPRTESDLMEPVSMYGESKREMEQMVRRTAAPELVVSLIRPPVAYGPREDQVFTWFKMVNRGFCPVVGDGEQPRISLVHVSDLINGLFLAADKTQTGVESFFMSGPEILTWNRIREVTCNILERHPFIFHIRPEWVKRVAALVEKTASFAGVYPVLNREKANEMILEWTCSSEKARKELGYQPAVSLEQGLTETLEWYKSNNWL